MNLIFKSKQSFLLLQLLLPLLLTGRLLRGSQPISVLSACAHPCYAPLQAGHQPHSAHAALGEASPVLCANKSKDIFKSFSQTPHFSICPLDISMGISNSIDIPSSLCPQTHFFSRFEQYLLLSSTSLILMQFPQSLHGDHSKIQSR